MTKTKKPGWVLFHIAQALTFAAIEVAAGLQLDGWLAIALYAIAARNVVLVVSIIWGLSVLAVEHLKEQDR